MTVGDGRIILVEDELDGVEEVLRRRDELSRDGRALAKPEVLTVARALAAAESGASRGLAWTAGDLLLLDCWDRDLADDHELPVRSTTFALDVLARLRARQAEGHEIPRVVAYSRSMRDPLLRAALAEFALPTIEVRVEGGDPMWQLRLDRSEPPFRAGSPLWAMFDRSVLLDRILEVVLGDRAGAAEVPDPDDPVYADHLATSCFASFHAALRDEHPDVWDECVLGGARPSSVPEWQRKAINRLGRRYLEVDPERSGTYRGLIELARRIAQPAPYVKRRPG